MDIVIRSTANQLVLPGMRGANLNVIKYTYDATTRFATYGLPDGAKHIARGMTSGIYKWLKTIWEFPSESNAWYNRAFA